jgi:glycosyltransferase involved in cell wall biosynthesis
MTRPLVSILIISYNQASFIDQTLTSALEQDYEPLEVVISDDNSTDGTAEIIQAYAARYPTRLKAITGGDRLGITGNCNRALRACTGRYIAFQGGDDILLPGKITAQVAWMEADPARVLCGHDVDVFESATGRTLYRWGARYSMPVGRGARAFVERGCLYAAMTIMVRASAMPARGFDERIAIASDWKFWIDCLASGGQYGLIEGTYSRYRRHQSSATNLSHADQQKVAALRADSLLTLDLVAAEHPHLRQACARGRATQYYQVGVMLLLTGDMRGARQSFRQAIQIDPIGQPRAWAGLAASSGPQSLMRLLVHRLAKRRHML